MPKPHTFPTLYDDVKTVSISFLTKHGYLKPNQWQSGTISWSRNGDNTGSISIQVTTFSEDSFIEFNYKINQIPINYKVQLVSSISNLGRGLVWYFVCPSTGKRCRKLHLADTYFYHRSAFRGCMYEVQTYSKEFRELNEKFKTYFKQSENYEQLYKKHFKKQYAGKPTKRYLKIIKKIETAHSTILDYN